MFNTITEVIEDLKQGKMVIVVDDEGRENEGDLTIIAETITPDTINFMLSHARGIICLTITEEHAKQIGLTHMVKENTSSFQTPFTITIDAKEGITTGVSTKDRATTILKAISDDCIPSDLDRPGHVLGSSWLLPGPHGKGSIPNTVRCF